MWVLTGRVNHLWQSLYDDKRKPHLIRRYPVSFVEVSPGDAERLGIVSGDMVAVESDRVRTQDQQISSGALTATAYVTDAGAESERVHGRPWPARSIPGAGDVANGTGPTT